MEQNLNQYIDHTLLKPTATKVEIKKLCEEAIANKFATVCVNPYWVSYAKTLLKDSDVGITTVIGFPLGATSTAAKVAEAKQAILDGATELDMVINLGALKDQDDVAVLNDLEQVRKVSENQVLKVILETGYLTEKEIIKACQLAVQAKLDFVKTSTGFGPRGASVEDVELMVKTVGDKIKIKAAGGVKTYQDAITMIKAGASRIGTSGGVAIINQQENKQDY